MPGNFYDDTPGTMKVKYDGLHNVFRNWWQTVAESEQHGVGLHMRSSLILKMTMAAGCEITPSLYSEVVDQCTRTIATQHCLLRHDTPGTFEDALDELVTQAGAWAEQAYGPRFADAFAEAYAQRTARQNHLRNPASQFAVDHPENQ